MPVNCSAAEAISDDEGESLPDTNHSCTSAKTIAMVNESGNTVTIKLGCLGQPVPRLHSRRATAPPRVSAPPLEGKVEAGP
jgi:hypothetical protein